jgi:transglutaminase superfamily protein
LIDLGPRPKHEVSPAANATVDEFIAMLVDAGESDILERLRRLRSAKAHGLRLMPSARLISTGDSPDVETRRRFVDTVAVLVDENLFGRSEMCIQFAALLARALRGLGISAEARMGRARYRRPDRAWFEWDHAWVVYDDQIVDGNVDSMSENPRVDAGVDPSPFWGPVAALPDDRQIELRRFRRAFEDEDVRAWWPRLQAGLQGNPHL